jgi:hypothetical protein
VATSFLLLVRREVQKLAAVPGAGDVSGRDVGGRDVGAVGTPAATEEDVEGGPW